MLPKLENWPITIGSGDDSLVLKCKKDIVDFLKEIREYCIIYTQLVEFELVRTIGVHQYL